MHVKDILIQLRRLAPGEATTINGHVVQRQMIPRKMLLGRASMQREPLYLVDTWGKIPVYEERAAYACVSEGNHKKGNR